MHLNRMRDHCRRDHRLRDHCRLMNWLVIAGLIVLFGGYRSYIYFEKQAVLEFARQYVKVTYGGNFSNR